MLVVRFGHFLATIEHETFSPRHQFHASGSPELAKVLKLKKRQLNALSITNQEPRRQALHRFSPVLRRVDETARQGADQTGPLPLPLSLSDSPGCRGEGELQNLYISIP